MDKKSIFIISASIILGFIILSISLIYSFNLVKETSKVNNRYEIIAPNENNIIVFDNEKGIYWRKFIESNEGPTEWEKEILDLGTGE
ncbi:hypothetical protein [Romboutsia sp.]|uniref:hypothetical protein n=1 Tax=Romboutsia sp. TaxID=1965302 RepID=UPI002C595673|nr:hypothetical protein [Romboutsia sp.]HSQ88879.1 hypothetical protein [Romboutsia sp.]